MTNYHNNHHNNGGHHNNRDNRNRDYQNRDNHSRDNHNRDGHNRDNRENRDNQVINTFVLGTKELDDKNAEFQYDKGWYIITDIVGEEKSVVYKSKNAQEAYTKWNVYIGRKKERLQRADKNTEKSE